jgi:simple sugar transport system permease protein
MMMIVPTLLKQRFGADEVVITLLLNFVVILLVQMLVEGPLKDPLSMGWPQSVPLLAEAKLH